MCFSDFFFFLVFKVLREKPPVSQNPNWPRLIESYRECKNKPILTLFQYIGNGNRILVHRLVFISVVLLSIYFNFAY